MAFGVFGANPASSGATAGGLFGGGLTTTTKPAFTFGAATTTAATGFGGFGSAFGSTAATATTSSLFGGFGTTAAQTSKPGGLFGGFGATTATTQSTFGGLGGSAFNFGQTKTTAAPGLPFGTTTGFGGLATTTSLGGFGTQSALQQQQQQQQQQAAANPMGAMASALTMPSIFGDERDSVIAKFNQLLALWGVGKGYYATNAAPVAFSTDNIFCRFKSLGYSCLPSSRNEDGLVSLELKHKIAYVRSNQQQFVESLHKVLGSKPTLVVCVEDTRELTPETCEVIMYVVQRAENGSTKKITASELFMFLNQATAKTQLQTLGVTGMLPKTTLSDSQLKTFLSNPPLGIDTILWEQAKKDNPNPEKLIPVPIVGFSELLNRIKHQQHQTEQYEKRLAITSEEIASLQKSHATTLDKLAQYKRRHLELGHRVIDIMTKQEISRKAGFAIEPEEEHLRIRVESLHNELSTPMQFRHLKQQQNALTELLSIIRLDFDDLKTIDEGLHSSTTNPRN